MFLKLERKESNKSSIRRNLETGISSGYTNLYRVQFQCQTAFVPVLPNGVWCFDRIFGNTAVWQLPNDTGRLNRDLYKHSISGVSIIPVPKHKWIDAVVTHGVGKSGIIEGVAEGWLFTLLEPLFSKHKSLRIEPMWGGVRNQVCKIDQSMLFICTHKHCSTLVMVIYR